MKLTDSLNIGKRRIYKLLLFGFLMLMMGRGSDLVIEVDPRTNPLGTMVLFGLVMCVILKEAAYRINYKPILGFIGLLFTWYVCHLFTDTFSPIYQGLQILLKAILGIFVIKYYGWKFGYYFETILVYLTLIGLVFWTIEMIVGAGTLASFAPLSCSMHAGTRSFGVYSLIYYLDAESSVFGILRNCGFCWEPGLYASMLIIGISFNIARFQGKGFGKSKNFWILIVGLITTLSTTGYSCLFVLLLLNSLCGDNGVVKKLIYIPLIISIAVYVASLPFMREKMERQSDIENFMVNSDNVFVGENGHVTVERFEGMYLSWLNVVDKPIVGYGPNVENSFVSKHYPIFLISNGNVNSLAILGCPLGLLFFFLLYQGTRTLVGATGYGMTSIIFIMFLLFTTSYNFSFEILTYSLCFSSYIKKNGTT